jgi:hypothetical protein
LAIHKGGNEELIDYLLGVSDINTVGAAFKEGTRKFTSTSLVLAAETGNTRIVSKLLENPKVNVNIVRPHNKRSALQIAAYRGFSEIVLSLLLNGAIPDGKDAEGISILTSAIQGGNSTIVTAILEACRRYNPQYSVSQEEVTVAENMNMAAVYTIDDCNTNDNQYESKLKAMKESETIVKQVLYHIKDPAQVTHQHACFASCQSYREAVPPQITAQLN